MIDNVESIEWAFTEPIKAKKLLGQRPTTWSQTTKFSMLTNPLGEDGGLFIDNETWLDFEVNLLETNLVLRIDQLDTFIIMLQTIQTCINAKKEKGKK
jgi:hypothetical protein